ncbi:MAG: hypothetical protein NC489_14305 [Ruminococcus flavefaciens]|nr:hypothetical protein [Ruminococcus flavefaciens]
MDNIYFESYEQFADMTTKMRKQMFEPDINLINMDPVFIDFDAQDEVPTGRFDTNFQGLYLECFAFIKENAPLYIMLNGAGDAGKASFSRWSYYKYSKGSILCISDPMIKMFNGLTLGWYYGTKDCDFREVIVHFVKKIASILKVNNKDIVFFGSSGGGAPVFECASGILGAKAVAINPQIVLKEYSYAEKFSMITGNDLEIDLLGHRNNAIYFLKNNKANPYLIIVNIRSQNDMKQIENIQKYLNIKIEYGLNIYDNLLIWLYDADVAPLINPHIAVEYYCVWFFIEYIFNNMDKPKDILKLKHLYTLVNEIWYDHWLMKRKKLEVAQCWADVLNIIYRSERCVAVWGSNQDAKRFGREVLDIQGRNFFHVRFAIDSDVSKKGDEFLGILIKHPSEVSNWDKLYIIVATELYRYKREVYVELEKLGLTYKKDFIWYKELE